MEAYHPIRQDLGHFCPLIDWSRSNAQPRHLLDADEPGPGCPLLPTILIGLLIGNIYDFLNGCLSLLLRILTIIVTLGIMSMKICALQLLF